MLTALNGLRARVNLNKNLIPVMTRSFISGIEQNMVGVVFQPFALALGASMAQLGLLNSLGGWSGLIPTLMYPWGGWTADVRGRKVVLLGASLAAMGAFSLFGAAGMSQALVLLFPAIILLGISQVYQPVNSALIGETVGVSRRGSAYSLIMLVVTVPGIFVPVVAGVVADRLGYAFVFPVAVALEVVAFLVLWRNLSEPRRPRPDERGWRGTWSFLQRAWIPPSDLRWFFIAGAMDAFAWGMGYGVFYGLLRAEYGFTAVQLGILSSVNNITWALTSLPVGRLVDRVGARPVMILSEALGVPLMLLWMTQSRFEVFAASMVIFALTAATWVPARSVYVTQTVKPARRGEIFGRYSAFSGLLAFPSAFIGGWLYDHVGFFAPFLGNLVFGIVTLAILVFLVRSPSAATIAAAQAAE